MTLSIGRAGLNPALLRFSSYEFDGTGEVKFQGFIRGASSREEMVAVREQMLGLVDNPDESVVPIVSSEDPSVDGFYRIRSVDVGNEVRGKIDSGSVVPWGLSAERVSSYASPQFDSRLLHALRSGSAVTSASAVPLAGVPRSTTMYERVIGLGSLTDRPCAASGGVGSVLVDRWTADDAQQPATWQAPPAGFYDGAATIERRVDGGPFVTVVGKQVHGGLDPNTGWRLSNGLVSVVPSEAIGGTAGTITVSAWGGTAWESAKEWQPSTISDWSEFAGFSVLRNSPECIAVRLVKTDRAQTLDLTIRRGDRNLQGVIKVRVQVSTLGIRQVSVAATTSITGGVRQTSDDADGNRFVLCSALDSAVTSGAVAVSNETIVDFGIGHEIGGSGASSPETAQDIANQYAAYVSERVDVANP